MSKSNKQKKKVIIINIGYNNNNDDANSVVLQLYKKFSMCMWKKIYQIIKKEKNNKNLLSNVYIVKMGK